MKFRKFLEELERRGELRRVKREVDIKFESTAILKRAEREKGPAIFFEKLKGYPQKSMVGNLFSTEERIALAMGAREGIPPRKAAAERLMELYAAVPQAVRPPKLVETSPAKEVILKEDFDVMREIPVPTHCEKDGGPYIAAGVVIAKHPDTGERIVQIIEMQVKGKNRIAISPVLPLMPQAFARAEEMRKPLEIAIAIGVEPALLLAAATAPEIAALDKYELASLFSGEPLEIVRAETVDLEIPADAEFVIEGEVIPGAREDMGPYGDYLRTYYWVESKPVIKVKTITMRKEPIYQDILADGLETVLLVALPNEVELLRKLKSLFPFVEDVYLTRSSSSHHAIISVRKMRDEDIRPLINWTLASATLVKHLIVIDADDVDPTNPDEVEWALVTRVRADKDVVITPGFYGSPLDPSSEKGFWTKMGIDATRPLTIPRERFEKSDVPSEVKRKVEEGWEDYFKE